MISQQSLSQQISLLERMLAVRLFDRDSRGTSLTAVGALFLPEARAVLDRADEAMDVVARAARGELGSLRLAFLATTTNYLLPPVVRAVRRRLPGLDVATEETTIAPLVEGLRKGATTSRSHGLRWWRASRPERWSASRCAPSFPRATRSHSARS